jgi:hypothetical protein
LLAIPQQQHILFYFYMTVNDNLEQCGIALRLALIVLHVKHNDRWVAQATQRPLGCTGCRS